MGTVPALAERTACIEPAGEAETAATAKLEALGPWAQGMAGREVERLLRKRKLGAPSRARVGLKGVAECMYEALPPEIKLNGPVEAMGIALGIVANMKMLGCAKSIRQHQLQRRRSVAKLLLVLRRVLSLPCPRASSRR